VSWGKEWCLKAARKEEGVWARRIKNKNEGPRGGGLGDSNLCRVELTKDEGGGVDTQRGSFPDTIRKTQEDEGTVGRQKKDGKTGVRS